jgi:fibronectin type 3 domain-containing protein
LAEGGEIDLSWTAVEGATSYVVYRGLEGHSYDVLGTVTPETTTFSDVFTEDGVRYRYSVAAVGADGGQGLESSPTFATADAVGPRVIAVQPRRDAGRVDVRKIITVWFDEAVAQESVEVGSVRLYRNGYRVQAVAKQQSSTRLTLDPTLPLRSDESYTVVVNGLNDVLGNQGPRFSWKFKTAPR